MTKYELTDKYCEQVYAGVLGKIIGVYAGKPFEQWSNARIEKELGEISYYVHEKFGQPIVQTDDDISGTFSFFRALAENDYDPNLTAEQIGDWWLNAIIKNRSILWWGGFGLSTEHTAYLRLLSGYRAPESGSIALNGVAVAEEIGSQIFTDCWGLVSPGNPDQAVDFARRAASVSHDGEAIYGAQIVAALISLAFVSKNIREIVKKAQSFIRSDSIISALIDDMLAWSSAHGDNWRATLRKIHEVYPYERFQTNCPMVSNHAIVLLALLHGNGDFSRSLMIANTSGYDTDCNSGNVGCVLGVMHGLSGIESGPDWRGPVADRLYVAAADGGRVVTDAVRETYEIVNSARALAGLWPLYPKGGARYHFSLPGSVQGFTLDGTASAFSRASLSNTSGALSVHFTQVAPGEIIRVGAPTFIPPHDLSVPGYSLSASPTVYSGQRIIADLSADSGLSSSISARLYINVYDEGTSFIKHFSKSVILDADSAAALSFQAPDTGGSPIAEVGLELTNSQSTKPVSGAVLVNWLNCAGTPNTVLRKPQHANSVWLKAWVNAVDEFQVDWVLPGNFTYRIIQNEGTGMVMHGTSDWQGYEVSAPVFPHLANRVGLAAAVRGLRQYVAIVLDTDKRIRLIRQNDDELVVLAESQNTWYLRQEVNMSLSVYENQVAGRVGDTVLTYESDEINLSGAIALLVEQGHVAFGDVCVRPA